MAENASIDLDRSAPVTLLSPGNRIKFFSEKLLRKA
jgi:hypothetical protein